MVPPIVADKAEATLQRWADRDQDRSHERFFRTEKVLPSTKYPELHQAERVTHIFSFITLNNVESTKDVLPHESCGLIQND